MLQWIHTLTSNTSTFTANSKCKWTSSNPSHHIHNSHSNQIPWGMTASNTSNTYFYREFSSGTKKPPRTPGSAVLKPTVIPAKRVKMTVSPEELAPKPKDKKNVSGETTKPRRTIEMPRGEDGKPFVLDVTGLPAPQEPGEKNIPYLKVNLDDIMSLIKDENATDISVVDLRGRVTWADFLVSATTKSTRHMRGMSEKLIKWLKQEQDTLNSSIAPEAKERHTFNVEGKESQEWFLIDTGKIVIQFFNDEARRHYDVDKLWSFGDEFAEDYYKSLSEEAE